MTQAAARRRRSRARLALVLVVLATALALAPPGSPGPSPAAADVAVPPADEILAGLRVEHPRLQVTGQDVVAIRQRIATDPVVGAWYATLHQRAHDLIGVAPVTYVKPDGLRLLETSREALRRLQVLGLVYLVDGEPEVAARGWVELEAITGFGDWNPIHFLDTAEMTHAAAIGLDWLYGALTPTQRATVVDAIRTKGLGPGLAAYDGTAPPLFSWWANSKDNWNQVTNGGLAIGALAIAEVDPTLAGTIVHEALTRLPRALVRYGPDGGWPEGVSYWLYATEYTTYLLSSLDTALGQDFGLSDIPGLDQAGDVPRHMGGPSGERWNWADDGEPRPIAAGPCLLWLAERYGRPDWRDHQLDHAAPEALDVAWYRPPRGSAPATPLDRWFQGIDVATMRGALDDPDTTFVGVKGGRPQENHNQLDVGSFVLDAEGVRWAMDLGRDDYNLPGYFAPAIGGKRWTYYRNRAEGHNTLVLDPGAATEDQWPRADAPLTRFGSSPDLAFAVVDMSSAYRRPVTRGVRLEDRSRVVIQDELDLPAPAELWWSWHTRAAIELVDGGRTALLHRDGRTIRIRLLAPTAATFEVRAAEPLPSSPDPAGQGTNDGVQVLAVHLDGVTTETVAVVVEPDETAPPAEVALRPIAEWTTEAPTPTTTTSTSTSTTATTSSTSVPSTDPTAATNASTSSRTGAAPARAVAATPRLTG